MFVANRARKIAKVTEEVGIQWKYVPSEKNVADQEVGVRATLSQMESKDLYDGPEWLLNELEWPSQPMLQQTSAVKVEEKPIKEIVTFTDEDQTDVWDLLLRRKPY